MYKTRRSYKIPIEELDLEKMDYAGMVVRTFNPGGTKKELRFFRKRTPIKLDKKLSQGEYNNIVKAIFQATSELMLEYEGGVFLPRHGYFSLLIVPYTKTLKMGSWYYSNLRHTQGYRYVPILDSDVGTAVCIKGMIMDRAYNKKLRKKFWKLIERHGFRPKNYYSTLKSMFSRNTRR